MNEVYCEYDTPKMPVPVIRIVFRNLLIAAGVLLIIYSILFLPILWTMSIFLFALAYYYNRGNDFQYEYLLLNDELHVDRIVANAKRKKSYRGDLTYLEILTDDPAKVEKYSQSGRPIRRRIFAHPKHDDFYLVLRNENKYDIITLNADSELIQGIQRRHPLQVSVSREKLAS